MENGLWEFAKQQVQRLNVSMGSRHRKGDLLTAEIVIQTEYGTAHLDLRCGPMSTRDWVEIYSVEMFTPLIKESLAIARRAGFMTRLARFGYDDNPTIFVEVVLRSTETDNAILSLKLTNGGRDWRLAKKILDGECPHEHTLTVHYTVDHDEKICGDQDGHYCGPQYRRICTDCGETLYDSFDEAWRSLDGWLWDDGEGWEDEL